MNFNPFFVVFEKKKDKSAGFSLFPSGCPAV